MKENGRTTNNMVMVQKLGPMRPGMKACTSMEPSMVKANSSGTTAPATSVNFVTTI